VELTTAATVRPATPADAPALARLRYEFRAALGVPDESEEAFVARCEAWMAARLAERDAGPWRCWVAEDGGGPGPVGTVWLQVIEKVPNPTPEPETHAYVTNLYVRPRARGGGTGSALLAAALAWCEARRVHAVILWPTPRSRSLYERHGFSTPASLMERVDE
jgi:GNAT superfamily N-acetyltransferase